MEILTEVEENVKKFATVILNDVIGLISPLRMQSAVDARDFSRLINSVKQKIVESEDIATNMFSQFKEIVNDMGSAEKPQHIEAFKKFIRRLGESIDKRVQEISQGGISISSGSFQSVEQSLNNILTKYIDINKDSIEKFWAVNSYEKIKEITAILINKSTNSLTIIVPNIEMFIPLDKFELDYSEGLKQGITPKKTTSKKSAGTGPAITKKQKKEIEEKLDLISKKVAELKGFELSHDIADFLSLISDANPESVVIESIQGWLNRLLVIRKHLDSNTQYLFLESIEKWKKNYSKARKKESTPEHDIVEELKGKFTGGKTQGTINSTGLTINIISSDPHENKHAIALAKKANIEYLQLKNNNIIAIIGNNSYLVFGVYQKPSSNSTFEISGFFTTFKPLIETLNPLIVEIRNTAKFPKEIEINRGFNEVIENINDYSGKKIAKRLKTLLDFAFEKDGISLDILELKLLIGKLGKLHQPLNDEMKEYVINELNNLNKKFSTLELIYPPEFRPPILKDEEKGKLEIEITPPEIEALDPEKIDNLFEIFIEKIDDLKGVEIGEQIDKFIEIILKLQGYSNIIEWKNSLSTVNETLEEPFREKIKEDLLSWKLGILQQIPPSNILVKEYPSETNVYSTQESASSIFNEDYVSPGLTQSQFEAEEDSSPAYDVNKFDPEIEMRELFNKIHTKLGELTGTEISKLMQNIIDIILETEGYSMAIKGAKDWISKLRKIKGPLESDLKEDFELEFLKWKEKYSGEDDETTLDFKPSFEIVEESSEVKGKGNGGTLNDKFNVLIQNAQTLKGNILSNDLQSIADILLQSHGAVAVNVIRQWISKLRSIKEPLEDEIKDDFIAELESWKEKFG
jgi:hypothetical protein